MRQIRTEGGRTLGIVELQLGEQAWGIQMLTPDDTLLGAVSLRGS